MGENMGEKRISGFTLIELVLVVGIVAIISALAIGKFSDIRKSAARKMNVANLKNIARTINTELAALDGENARGMFAYAEALIDVDGRKAPLGAEGEYVWREAWYDGAGGVLPGIYCGIKVSAVVENAAGVSSGEAAALFEAHEQNTGLDAFAAQLGIHYLIGKEVEALRDAGVSIVSYHNYSNAQAKNLGWAASEWCTRFGLRATGGGPGMRADLSACYPAVLTNGSAVAVLNPLKCASVYHDLGLGYAATNNVSGLSETNPETYYQKGICARLVAVGLGRDCEATTKYFESAPRCMTLDRKRYRNYILLFEMKNGSGNGGYAARFVGVLDPEGNTVTKAQYNADWAS